jgi:hypothetical protein
MNISEIIATFDDINSMSLNEREDLMKAVKTVPVATAVRGLAYRFPLRRDVMHFLNTFRGIRT